MTTIERTSTAIEPYAPELLADENPARRCRVLGPVQRSHPRRYRHDLRGFFQWTADNGVVVLEAKRPHIELFRAWMEDRGLAASTIDRRLSTVCGFYRFAHIDGRIGSNPAQYVRRPRVHPTEARGLDRSELGVFLFTDQIQREPAAPVPGATTEPSGTARGDPTNLHRRHVYDAATLTPQGSSDARSRHIGRSESSARA